MARLSSFTRNQSRVSEGERIVVGPAGDEFGITTRGFTPKYKDTFYALKAEAARRLNRTIVPGAPLYTPDTLPPSEEDKAQGIAISRECVLGVDGLQKDDNGTDIPVDEFKAMLESGNYPVLVFLAISAAGRVGDERMQQNEAAVGN